MLSPLRSRARRRLREPFGKAGLTVAIVALVMAMVGGAYAAGALTGKQKKEVEKIAKKYAGKNGANGTNGAAGAKGDTGAAGSNGTNGTNGSPGAAGKSVVVVDEEPAGCPGEEGVAYEVEGSGVENEVCNGAEGSPWTAGGTLPVGKTETGSWSALTAEREGEPGVFIGTAGLSFPIPLAAPITEFSKVKVVSEGATPPTECENGTHAGTAGPENPEATSGFVCVYVAHSPGAPFVLGARPGSAFAGGIGASTAGLLLSIRDEEGGPEQATIYGTFAVTG